MIKITMIAVGKLKETYWKQAEAEYLKRLSQYANIDVIELVEEAFVDSEHERDQVRHKEAEKIKKHLKPTDVVIMLHETGKAIDSVEFSQMLEAESSRGERIVFVIGGPLGLDRALLKTARIQLSLSSFTFPHQMVRVILSEQIYRAMTISHKKQYHY